MNQTYIIAIDGYSACGKSTIAKQLADHYNIIYVDTGAMYRAVTLYFLRNKVNYDDSLAVENALDNIQLEFKLIDKKQHIILNGEDVSELLRSREINKNVSPVAKITEVRKKLVAYQRTLGEGTSLVMDGRDIGTVVFPDAQIKLFITSDIKIRTDRRFSEAQAKGLDITKEEVEENLLKRDFIDSSREDSPLKQAEDAILIDNSYLSREEQLSMIIDIIDKRIKQ